MAKARSFFLRFLLLAGLPAFSSTLLADPLDFQGRVDFNFHLQSMTSDWRYGNEVRNTRISRMGFAWSEMLGDRFAGGLLLGYVDISQGDNPLDAGKYSDGYYGGVQLEGLLIGNNYLNLKLNLSFLYNDTQNITPDQGSGNVWTQTEAKLLARIALGKRLGLRLNLNNYWLRGEQRDSGTQTGITRFDNEDSAGYGAGIDVVVDKASSIGLDWAAGNREGARLYFRRRF